MAADVDVLETLTLSHHRSCVFFCGAAAQRMRWTHFLFWRHIINMLSLLLHTFTSACVLTVSSADSVCSVFCFLSAPACVSAVTTETVVGVAGRKVRLPCRSEAVSQKGVEVCWGRGEPSLFTCHNMVINAAAERVTYRSSYRYSVSSSSSLSIFNSRPSDAGFYHCRVQLPGLFNDQTSTVHLIIITRMSTFIFTLIFLIIVITLNHSSTGREVTEQTGSDVTGPMVALVQSSVQQQVVGLQSFVGNTLRISFIVFVPALLLTAAYSQSLEDESESRDSQEAEPIRGGGGEEEEQLRVDLVLLGRLSEGGSSSSVVGRTGEDVTLTCNYDIKSNGVRSVCWGRGQIPNSGCSNQLISTDGHEATAGVSGRYQLLGRLDEGDVSLTILNLTETDAGRYGCRVDIYGWFNDEKHHFDLTVEPAAETRTSTTSSRDTTTEQTTHTHTTGQLTSTQSVLTSSSSSLTDEQASGGGGGDVTVILVCILFGLVAMATAGGLFIIGKRWRRLNKIPQQQVQSSHQFSSTSSTLQLHRRGSAVENVYQIDEGEDRGEYEFCP
ncbi:uncharacterized protein ABDE67_010520 [Symphorus nematophorus]